MNSDGNECDDSSLDGNECDDDEDDDHDVVSDDKMIIMMWLVMIR